MFGRFEEDSRLTLICGLRVHRDFKAIYYECIFGCCLSKAVVLTECPYLSCDNSLS